MDNNDNILLNEKELKEVSGGETTNGICPHCHKYVSITVNGKQMKCNSCQETWSLAY